MAKKGKVKISKVKRNNQTTNKMRKQGKLRLQRHKNKVQKQKQPTQTQEPIYSSDSDAASGDEWADMLDEEEQKYILGRIAKQPNLLSNVPEEDKKEQKKPKKRKITQDRTIDTAVSSDSGAESETDNSEVEEKYEAEMAERPAKKMRPLLPIKTKDGILERSEECEDTDSDEEQPDEAPETSESKQEESQDSDSGMEVTGEEGEGTEEVVTAVQLLAARRDKLKHEKLRIGALCSSLLENPEKKILGHDYTEDSCQLEYFKPDSPACRAMDFAPISPNDHIGGVSLKPYSLQYDHVTPLGTVYTVNHTVLNITFSNIKWKTMKFRFQFSKQKNSDNHCRNIVISNNVTINDQSMFYYDCYWPISDGNPNGQSHILDFEATDDVVVNRGQYYFNIPTPQMLTKKLKEVEKELLETEARENSEARKKQLTEVTKTVFHIYFRILKTAPKSQLLEAVLNGLAKFSHVINVEYYSELVSLLARLCADEELSARARLQCARAALAVLAAAGDALNFDPAHFHADVYANAIHVHAGNI
ncbi:Nucleolar complex protein 3-like [Papilio machaon]|uniref:Nucleolar complex protein 3-like n=1 Tax=Papilio machaon TaxID=76193 RepID=A0A194RDI6_PAPMA|nr:Nucleolar complex protein 3-like [Papilio machaon]